VAADLGGSAEKSPVMKPDITRPDTATILAGLKDFQRETVEYVFGQLYGQNPTSRFLVADEVGLGKTLVARGVTAKAIDHLWDKADRIDIVCICSNADIARQNVNRLNVTPQQEFTHASRITMLPTLIQDLQQNPLNFISLTPGTSFDLKSSLGHREERVLLYRLLEGPWSLRGSAPKNVLQGNCTKDSFRHALARFGANGSIDPGLARQFVEALEHHVATEKEEGKPTLRSRFRDLCKRFKKSRKHIPPDDRYDRALWIGEVRTLLAATCLRALKPDLIILDEFQRFKQLLAGDSELGQLASDLFEYEDVRMMLLSATPYKMYTLANESAEENHYEDFVRTLRFLQFDGQETAAFEALLDDYRREIFRLGSGTVQRLTALKSDLETRLRRVMVRTERLAVTENRDGMLREVPRANLVLTTRDVETYPKLQRVAAALRADDILEYWKSAPFLLNFMEDYEIKRAFTDALEVAKSEEELANLLASSPELLLAWKDVTSFAALDPGNAGVRKLLAETVDAGAWKLLWVPPSLPYYRLDGGFAQPYASAFTKRLVFSSWRVVPKMLACLLSYEVERAMMCSFEKKPKNTPEARKRRRPLLRFARSDGRLTGMPVLGLIYPSLTLAEVGDPLALGTEAMSQGRLLSVNEARQTIAERLRPLLRELASSANSPGADEAWYWAAPILLDLKRDTDVTRQWFAEEGLADVWAGEQPAGDDSDDDGSLWQAHVEYAQNLVNGDSALGTPPDDLAEVLADLALAGPAVCAFRSLALVSGETQNPTRLELRDAAGQIGHAFLHLFNLPEVTAMIRGQNSEEPYWRRVLEYCASGCLQAVMDEYAHVLRDLQGLSGAAPEKTTREVAEMVQQALTLRTSTLGVDEIAVDAAKRKIRLENRGMRGRFALRFGEERPDESEHGVTRSEQVREAFNSPFWPFVLVTTSVGQEGLDFHPYCHAVVHWNLPANPVDLEQREGRIHRYKGHAVRKNLAKRFGLTAIQSASADPWDMLFAAGTNVRGADSSDLVPFWVYPLEGGAMIERHLVALPLSRDIGRIESLHRSLAVYRMVFGQSRQEDLISYLLTQVPEGELKQIIEELRVDLRPPKIRTPSDGTTVAR
jgi:hypothetical protein